MVRVHFYGLLLILPVLSSVIAMSLLPPAYWSFLLPLLAVIFTLLFLPYGMGNAYLARLVRSFCNDASGGRPGYIVQLTLLPRLRAGVRALLEDADDIGFLSFSDSALVFQGDSVRFSIPYGYLSGMSPQNIGIRGLFVYGRRLELAVEGFPGAGILQFAERSSLLLPASRGTTRRLRDELLARTTSASAPPTGSP
jgi:hypothetical protein